MGNELVLETVNQDFSISPDLNVSDHTFFLQGWAIDPTVVITQTVPLHATVRGLYMEVMA